ncbi:hypothetical protein DCS32_09290 [Dokdonia sp. Dokd-P16]|uniref:hypothetical protein n=1 Tax=Dokdonia sp. Dokd-P16 TaxID=2173169 RepID=UPI000D547E46|nr:hypothetical protein [Dokdonia sp. Dokd-P16]AWH74345.1 hypothetical protein DCS32_09290 [Dokdonia sp. Dokd-P16]
MSYNIIAYSIYGVLMSIVIIQVGKICYRNGNVFVASLMPDNLKLCTYINKVLLVGYYLVNLGYSVYMISTWNAITSPHDVISNIASHAGQIIMLLAALHYINIAGLQLLFNKQSLSKF